MRVVIQRVSRASVSIDKKIKAQINKGLLLFIGVENEDGFDDAEWLSNKISNIRLFNDGNGIMNLSVIDIKGELLVVSQFTLHAKTKKGNRPSYIAAARPEVAIPIYEHFIAKLSLDSSCTVQTGEFGAMMEIELVNDGPVTILIDTKSKE